MNVCADQGSYEFLTCSVGRREVVIEPLPIGPDEPGRGEHGDHRAEGGPQRQEENHHPRHDRPTQLETRTHGSELGGEPGAPGARALYTRTSPKFANIIPDKLCESMVAGINKPFSQTEAYCTNCKWKSK